MRKTILLTRYEFSPWVTRILFFLFGISQSIQGIERLNGSPLTTGKIIFGSFLLLTGILLIFFGIALFSPTVKFSPKLSADEDSILIRKEVFSRTKKIEWKDIKEITFGSFELNILRTNNTNQVITLKTNAETSIEVKKLLREIADTKSIAIKGG